jgi:hypothetical protein
VFQENFVDSHNFNFNDAEKVARKDGIV